MAKAETLKDYYLALLSDTLSANEQMLDIVGDLHELATHDALKAMLAKTKAAIPAHNKRLEELITAEGGRKHAEHCKGMEGIVAEAKEHAIKLKTDDDAVRDAAIIHVIQQMTHYGIAGYGTGAAMADAVGLADAAVQLRADLKQLYTGDEYLSFIAERKINPVAA